MRPAKKNTFSMMVLLVDSGVYLFIFFWNNPFLTLETTNSTFVLKKHGYEMILIDKTIILIFF
jgi:hypothetical protein